MIKDSNSWLIGLRCGCLEIIETQAETMKEIGQNFKDYNKFISKDSNIHTLTTEYSMLPGGVQFFYNTQNPNTENNLIKAIKNNELVKIRCTRCHKEYYTDLESFNCIQRRVCSKNCSSNIRPRQVETDYTKSLYKLTEHQELIQPVKDFENYFPAYCESIAYISDIHLLHHLKYYTNKDTMLDNIVDTLCNSFKETKIIIFCGDISSDLELNIDFFTRFINNNKIKAVIPKIYTVLGNHEYTNFIISPEKLKNYTLSLEKIGIVLLHNNRIIENKYLIFGGMGISKDCTVETTIFQNEYKKAIKEAKNNKLTMICVTHYPIPHHLDNINNSETIYFSGHTHKNKYTHNEKNIVYSDNQVGYDNVNISFKIAKPSFTYNPYKTMKDGVYITSFNDYMAFYRYTGEFLSGIRLSEMLNKDTLNIYVIKHKGYYGFFLINTQDKHKGVSILNGGKSKHLTNSTDITIIYNNFEAVIYKYLGLIVPLKNFQTKLSNELIKLSFSGEIHGCIVDIDFIHHIMINPFDLTLFFYASNGSLFKIYDSFYSLIEDMENTNIYGFNLNYIKELYKSNSLDPEYILATKSTRFKSKYNSCLKYFNKDYNLSDITEVYTVSNRINNLNRLLSSHILRDFCI